MEALLDSYLEEGKRLTPGALLGQSSSRRREWQQPLEEHESPLPTPRAHACCAIPGSRAAVFLLTSVYLPPSCAALPTLLRVKPAEAPSKARVP